MTSMIAAELNERTLVELARAGLSQVVQGCGSQSAFVPGGRNGPYFDLETPYRNSAHWMVTFVVAGRRWNQDDLLETGRKLSNFIVRDPQFKVAGIPVNRQSSGKDQSNGLIGPAWIIESLAIAGRYLEDSAAVDFASNLSSLNRFDPAEGCWVINDPVRGDLGVDRTLNHQAAYAAALMELGDDRRVEVGRFLDACVERHFAIREDGLIRHRIASPGGSKKGVVRRVWNRLRKSGRGSTRTAAQIDETERAAGYHLYDLYTFSRLRRHFPEHALFQSAPFRTALSCAASADFFASLAGNRFSYDYNAPGFELPLIVSAFHDMEPRLDSQFVSRAWREQVGRTFCGETCLFAGSASDGTTLAARLFELFLALESGNTDRWMTA